MGTELTTTDGAPVAGWAFKVNRVMSDIEGVLETDGVITTWAMRANERVDLLRPGQRCFLYVSGKAKERTDSAMVGVGEVTSTAYQEDGDEGPDRPWFVDVEILMLKEPVPIARMTAHEALRKGELLGVAEQANPVVLSPAEMEALDTFDLTALDPAEARVVPTVEMPHFVLRGGDAGDVAIDQGADGRWIVTHYLGDEADGHGTFGEFAEAVASLTAFATRCGATAASQQVDGDATSNVVELVDPLAVFDWAEAGTVSVVKFDHAVFAVCEVDSNGQIDPPEFTVYPDLGGAILDVARALTTTGSGTGTES
ncbi:MAG: EVE domain-containing protein [Aquihabitans sp.]